MKPGAWKVLEHPPHHHSRRRASVVLQVKCDQFTDDGKAVQSQGLNSDHETPSIPVLPTLGIGITQE